MATLKELRDERLRKLDELKKLGINPYPAQATRTHKLAEITSSFDEIQGRQAKVLGRITNIRKFGKIAFIVIRDDSGQLQLFLSGDKVENLDVQNSQLGFDQLPLLDIGDFIETSGEVIKTQTGEISVDVEKLRLLSKSLRPLPGHDGFANKEERFRRRYVDTNVNKDVYERFIRRSRFWDANREFLKQSGFSEINIPVLEHTTGGADAKPFKTHMDVLDQDFYLRISHELPLKRLIGGGYEKVFDIGPRFRNEHYTDEHLPEHVAMEWYWAYANWQDGMRFMTDMFRYVYDKVYGKLQFKINGMDVDLAQDWQQLDYAGAIRERYGLDVFSSSLDDVKQKLQENKLEVEEADNIGRGVDKLWKNMRKDIAGPVWLVNTPLIISPLAKTNLDNPQTVQRFQPIIAGTELGNGYRELNDPLDQLSRFLEQQKMRDSGDEEAQMLDIDFVEMLEYGMPPTCGWGHSERAFWVFEGVSAREGVPFPQLRREIDSVTRSIYPDVKFE
jgi:lysyl-tRNA synthetase class 2